MSGSCAHPTKNARLQDCGLFRAQLGALFDVEFHRAVALKTVSSLREERKDGLGLVFSQSKVQSKNKLHIVNVAGFSISATEFRVTEMAMSAPVDVCKAVFTRSKLALESTKLKMVQIVQVSPETFRALQKSNLGSKLLSLRTAVGTWRARPPPPTAPPHVHDAEAS
ncbi:hypothetical protein BS47DRAFT_1395113 [Hydnum rufescens UP504]|uniref:Uncharacterized protein n=1 Tax=Hydnum rufescens UP504 TaxID=1448309 RepID=A0A9P6AT62_9AGAM|nr:hypothetical protein BS47DRAFT_1395113 [Hydnum rufescens UP504]